MIEGFPHPVVRFLVELGDADIADVAAFQMRAHRLNVDNLADDRELLNVPFRSALNSQLDRGVGLAPHLVYRFLERKALDRRVVDPGDQIASQQPGARRGRIVDWAHHLDQPIFHHHFEAQATEFLALHAGLEVLQGFRIEIIRMRVEGRQHAVDRRLDHLLVVRLLGVIVAHFVEHFAQTARACRSCWSRRRAARRARRRPARHRRRLRRQDKRDPSSSRAQLQSSC